MGKDSNTGSFDIDKVLNIPEHKMLWPEQGDKAFTASADPDKNAYVQQSGFSRLVAMMQGFKKAADILIEAAQNDKKLKGELIYPILFNYRHFIELSLKYILNTYGHYFGVESNWRTHDLSDLLESYFKILEEIGDEYPNEADMVIRGMILEFAKLDPDSSHFRYPVDKKNQVIEMTADGVSLRKLAKRMQALENYFNGCDGYLDNASQHVNEGYGEY